MRQYRGLTKEGERVFGWYIPLNGKHHILPDKPRYDDSIDDSLIEVIPETVGQSTGLKDKKGVEIDWWEGDLLKSGGDVISVITYRETYGQWCICTRDGKGTMSLVWALSEGFEKVGTIHDK